MTCEHNKEALIEAAAAGAEPDAELHVHLKACSSCRATFDHERTLFASIDAGLRSSANAEVSPAFLTHFWGYMDHQISPKRRPVPVWTMATAAAAMVVGAIFIWNPTPRSHVNPALTSSNVTTEVLPQSNLSAEPARGPSQSATPGLSATKRRRHSWSSVSRHPQETTVLVPEEQKRAFAQLIEGLRSGEVEGKALFASNHVEDQPPGIAPLSIAPLEPQSWNAPRGTP